VAFWVLFVAFPTFTERLRTQLQQSPVQHAMCDVKQRVGAVSQTKRCEAHLPEKARLQCATQKISPKGAGVLRHFALPGRRDAEDDHCVLDKVSELRGVHVEDGGSKSETLCQASDLFGDILSITCFGAVQDKSCAWSAMFVSKHIRSMFTAANLASSLGLLLQVGGARVCWTSV